MMATQRVVAYARRPQGKLNPRQRAAWHDLPRAFPKRWGVEIYADEGTVCAYISYRSRKDLGAQVAQLVGIVDRLGDGWEIDVHDSRQRPHLGAHMPVLEGPTFDVLRQLRFWTGIDTDPEYHALTGWDGDDDILGGFAAAHALHR